MKNSQNSAKNVNVSANVKLAEKQNSEIISKMSSKEKDALIARLTEKLEKNQFKSVDNNFVMYRFQMIAPKLSSEEQKKKRNQIRTKLFNFCDSISLNFVLSIRTKDSANKQKYVNKMNEEIKEFIAFYKSTYVTNDFSLSSLFSGNDEKKKKVSDMLDIIKEEYLSKQIKEEKKEQKKIVPPVVSENVSTKE
jgi:hypothetical protein